MGRGLAERNAAQPLGDFRFIFAGDNGCARYPSGVIEMVYVTVDQWGEYEHCQRTPQGTHLCGDGRAGPGKEWFSFPTQGKNKHWWEECNIVRKTVHEVYGGLCKALKCKCDGTGMPGSCPQIVNCLNSVGDDEKVKTWLSIFGVKMTDDEAALYNTTGYWDLPVHSADENDDDDTDDDDDDDDDDDEAQAE